MREGKPCVLFVSPVPPPVHGGALAMQYLLEELRGTDITVLHVDSKFADGLADMGRFSLKKIFRLAGYLWQMLRHVLRGGVDLVVLTPTFHFKPFLKDAMLVWWSTLILRRRSAAWFHMDYRVMGYEKRSRLTRWFVRTTLRRCERYILVAERLRGFMPEWMESGRIDALPNGIPAPIPPRARPEDGRLRVLYLSNLEPDKGWEVLLEAARNLCREFSHVEFVFHGRPAFGLTEGEVRRSVAADDAGGRIRYPGPAYGEAKWQALADADVFAFPSFHEAFPLSILEALAAGLPIVATDVGGVPDAVTANEGGFIVPPRDAAALQSALRQLILDSPLRTQMGAWNRRRYEEDYTVAAFGRKWHTWLRANTDAPTS
ncbi:MAG TPA: glycosyltransferase family 4 protein [Verrucomicrobiales bacterium]|nr:glycosyltransferase family 4 protein [Verrucomicrobiales bacterium]